MKYLIPIPLFLTCLSAQAFTPPPCFSTPAQLISNGGSVGYPQLWESPTGQGGAVIAACKDTTGWHTYEMHWTSTWLASTSGVYESVHALNRFMISPDRFWSNYTTAVPCSSVSSATNTDKQLVALCTELNTKLASWLLSLPK